MAGCSTTPMMGGKHRKGHKKTRKLRKTRGGAGYGFGAPVTVGTLEVVPNSTSTPYSSASGKPIADPYATTGSSSTLMGGKRRTRKGVKKTRKTKKGHRKMKGGAGVYNAGAVGTGFTGAVSGMPGSQTYGGYTGYAAKVPVGGPTAGPDGVYRA